MDGIDPWEFLSWLLYGVDLCLSRSSELEYYWFVYTTLRRTRLGSVCSVARVHLCAFPGTHLFGVPLLKLRAVEENIPKVILL